jgi:penicillin-binding protein 1A
VKDNGTVHRLIGGRWVICLAAVSLILAGCSWTGPRLVPQARPPAETSRIFAADGSTLASLHADENRELVPLSTMPKSLIDAVVAIEDERFWDHSGIDLRSMLRAAYANAKQGKVVEGGSTITQQYVKNELVGSNKTVNRKIREAVLAWRLEHAYTKQHILELYLNTVYFGQGAYGVQAAAKTYFGETVDRLTLAQSAMLAGVLHAPATADPFDHPTEALQRRSEVLAKMQSLGRIGQTDVAAATQTPVTLRSRANDDRYPAGYFVEQVKRFILDDPHFGATPEIRRDLLLRGGLRITTTLDPVRQAEAEKALADKLAHPDRDPNGALVSIEPRTGYVRALVGGRDFFGPGPQDKFDLAIQGRRQAGSSFKPFVLAAALEGGITLDKVYEAPPHLDIPFPAPSQEIWHVDNYEGEGGGALNLVDATVHSVNTVYAQLVMDVGPDKAVAMATRLGITSPLQHNPAAVLGTNDVSPLEMASAYGTFANGGIRVDPTFVVRVTKADGTVVYNHTHTESRVLPASIASTVVGVLQQVVARGTGHAASLDRPMAGKTGTAENWHDAWFVGFTPDLVTSVWIGFPDRQRSMVPPATPIRVQGGSWPAAIWHAYMQPALKGVAKTDFPAVAGSASSDIAPATTIPTPPTTIAPLPTFPKVPDVVGTAVEAASSVLTQAGFQVVRRPVADDGDKPGTVLGQLPAGGQLASPGSLVRLDIAAPSSVLVPDLLGLTEAEARDKAEAAGFNIDVTVLSQGSGARAGRVWRQDPVGSSRRPQGTVISAWVNPGG